MEESQQSSIPVPKPRKFRRILNEHESEIEKNIRRLPRCIPYYILVDNIIWLDLLANERNLTFADRMIASNRLNIFNTAVDCIEFLNLSSQRLNLPSTEAIYSIIVSGVYAINRKVIHQLLPYGCVNQIYLILHESCYENLPHLIILDRKINVIYNDNPDIVMHRICNDCSNFETFIQYNNELHMMKNDLSNNLSNNVSQESTSPRMASSYQWDNNHNNRYTRLNTNENLKRNCSVTCNMFNEESSVNNIHTSTGEMPLTNQMKEKKLNVTTNNIYSDINFMRRPHAGLLSAKSTYSPMGVRSPSYQKMNLIELPLPSSSQHLTDTLALKELEQIAKNVNLLSQIVNEFQMGELTRHDHLYKQIEEQALALMIRCDKFTDVDSEVKSLRRQIIHTIQQVLTELDLKVSARE